MNFKRNDKDKYDRTYDYSTKQDYVSRLLKDRETAEVKFKPAKGGFFINDWLEGRYLMLMSKSARPSQFDDLTGIEKPSWHLETDGFWHLQYP